MKAITTKVVRVTDRLFGCLAEISTQEQDVYPAFDKGIVERAKESIMVDSWVLVKLKQSMKTRTIYIADLALCEAPE